MNGKYARLKTITQDRSRGVGLSPDAGAVKSLFDLLSVVNRLYDEVLKWEGKLQQGEKLLQILQQHQQAHQTQEGTPS